MNLVTDYVKIPEIVWKSDAKERKLRLGRDLSSEK